MIAFIHSAQKCSENDLVTAESQLVSTVKGKALIRTLTMREKLGDVVNIVTLNMTTTQVMMSITTMQTASAMSSSEKELSNRLHIK